MNSVNMALILFGAKRSTGWALAHKYVDIDHNGTVFGQMKQEVLCFLLTHDLSLEDVSLAINTGLNTICGKLCQTRPE